MFSSHVLPYVEFTGPVFEEISRVLVSGGRQLHIVPTASWRFWTIVGHYLYVIRRLLGFRSYVPGKTSNLTLGEAAQKRGMLWLLRAGLFPPGLARQSAMAELYSFSRWGWRRFSPAWPEDYRRVRNNTFFLGIWHIATPIYEGAEETLPYSGLVVARLPRSNRTSEHTVAALKVWGIMPADANCGTNDRPGRAGSRRLGNPMQRLLDIVLSGAGLLVGSPLIGLTALAVFFSLGRPVLFCQMRGGYRGRVFRLWKFRTMTDKRSSSGSLLPDAERLTRLGRLLRRSSLDELPQLWNVFIGDMSLVGPRPLLAEYLPRYSAYQSRRHEVKPGITGWVQVQGRNALSWEEKLQLDVWYVDHRTKWLDLKILAMTVWKVMGREGISQGGHATMPEFLGTQEGTDIQSTRSRT